MRLFNLSVLLLKNKRWEYMDSRVFCSIDSKAFDVLFRVFFYHSTWITSPLKARLKTRWLGISWKGRDARRVAQWWFTIIRQWFHHLGVWIHDRIVRNSCIHYFFYSILFSWSRDISPYVGVFHVYVVFFLYCIVYYFDCGLIDKYIFILLLNWQIRNYDYFSNW